MTMDSTNRNTRSRGGAREIASECLFAVHALIVLLFFVPFLVPSSVWPQRIEVHFAYLFGLFTLNYSWGLIWTLRLRDRFYTVCPLTTLMQCLRGHGFWEESNYRYWFTEELLDRLRLQGLSREQVTLVLRMPVLVSGVLFVLKQFDWVLY